MLNDATVLPATGLTLGEARSRLSGLHFAKESLTRTERDVLYIAEGLLRLIEETADGHTSAVINNERVTVHPAHASSPDEN